MPEKPCDQISAFFDGELADDEAEQFCLHLEGCDTCPDELEDMLQLAALHRRYPRHVSMFRRPWLMAGTAMAAAAALVFGYLAPPERGGPDGASEQLAMEFTTSLDENRKIAGRLSYGPADGYRIYSVPRSDDGNAEQELSSRLVGLLEESHEYRGAAAASLLMKSHEQVEKFLDLAEESPDALSDRALLLLQIGGKERAERAVVLLSRALDENPEHPQALWNRGLALESLHLEFGAAAAFDAVARLGEPGWSEEARRRADALRKTYNDRKRSWNDMHDKGRQMVERGTLLSASDVREQPSLARHYLYEAIRTARNVGRVEELRPRAELLDGIYQTDVLGRLIDRVASSDFTVRGPLAAQYFEAWKAPRKARSAENEGRIVQFLDRLRAAGQPDILLGALRYSTKDYQQSDEYFAEYRRVARELDDPWFVLVAEEKRAGSRIDAGRFMLAIELLRAALQTCEVRPIDYRCVRLERLLGKAHLEQHRRSLADHFIEASSERARRYGDHFQLLMLLPQRARLLHLRDDVTGGWLPLARAYLEERPALERSCAYQVGVHTILAQMLINGNRFEEARSEMDRTRGLVGPGKSCSDGEPPLDLERATVRAHLLQAPGSGDAAAVTALRTALGELRIKRSGWPGALAYIDYLEGRLLIDREPETGKTLLRRAIARAADVGDDIAAKKARAYSYSVLVQSAARRGEHGDALTLLAEEIESPPPGSCAVGLAREESLLIVARGPNGTQRASVRPLEPGELLPGDWSVPGDIAAVLDGCDQVDVYARAPFFGKAMLLPDTLAWRFRTRPASQPSPQPAKRRIVIVANVESPPEEDLPPLHSDVPAPYPDDEQWILGPRATPSQVLGAMVDATEIEIRAHGGDGFGINHVVLSRDSDDEYRLTADKVRAQTLQGAPVVVLGACHAGSSSRHFHETWGLATAFREAGARAVFASPEPVADLPADAFFAAVRAAVRKGTPPAIALRDQRLAQKSSAKESSSEHNWVRSVVVFE